jgi:hypothetical protein
VSGFHAAPHELFARVAGFELFIVGLLFAPGPGRIMVPAGGFVSRLSRRWGVVVGGRNAARADGAACYQGECEGGEKGAKSGLSNHVETSVRKGMLRRPHRVIPEQGRRILRGTPEGVSQAMQRLCEDPSMP